MRKRERKDWGRERERTGKWGLGNEARGINHCKLIRFFGATVTAELVRAVHNRTFVSSYKGLLSSRKEQVVIFGLYVTALGA